MRYIIKFMTKDQVAEIEIYASCVSLNDDGVSILVDLHSTIVFPGKVIEICKE